VKTQLVSYGRPVPAVVRYRSWGELVGEHEPAPATDIAPRPVVPVVENP
jgi:hypothetical protein